MLQIFIIQNLLDIVFKDKEKEEIGNKTGAISRPELSATLHRDCVLYCDLPIAVCPFILSCDTKRWFSTFLQAYAVMSNLIYPNLESLN